MDNRGFALIVVLLIALMVGALAAIVHFQTLAVLDTSRWVAGRLHSLVLAENGVEWAKSVLGATDVGDLPATADDLTECRGSAEWRSPLPLETARRTPIDELSPGCGDGLPRVGNRLLWPASTGPGGEIVLVRFSLDPRAPEPPEREAVVVVRSMGIVPLGAAASRATGLSNQVSLVEAHLRRPRPFPILGAVNLLGPGGDFEWLGNEFRIDGGEVPGIALLSYPGPGLAADLQASLGADGRFRVAGAEPSILEAEESDWRGGDLMELVGADLAARLFAGIESRAALFPPGDGEAAAHLFRSGGVIRDSLRGLVLAAGDLTLAEGSSIEGILVHLGGGALRLQGPTAITGALWAASLETRDGTTAAAGITLSVSGATRVTHQEDWIRIGLSLLPPEQLLWRILFPEMRL